MPYWLFYRPSVTDDLLLRDMDVSTTVLFFTHEQYPNCDLNVYVEDEFAKDAFFLINIGYQFGPTAAEEEAGIHPWMAALNAGKRKMKEAAASTNPASEAKIVVMSWTCRSLSP